jgi:hypothetical protein
MLTPTVHLLSYESLAIYSMLGAPRRQPALMKLYEILTTQSL